MILQVMLILRPPQFDYAVEHVADVLQRQFRNWSPMTLKTKLATYVDDLAEDPVFKSIEAAAESSGAIFYAANNSRFDRSSSRP